MAQRNRASGWKHAKLSGHSNEARVKELLDNNQEYRIEFMERIGYASENIESTSIGGLHETNVSGILGKKTKSKTDLKIKLTNGNSINVSIKKSLGGQVYFVRASLFIDVFEKQFNKSIPQDVQRAIKLFWAAADDAPSIIEKYGEKTDLKSYNLQVRHKSLNATTLKAYDIGLYNSMLRWFKDNIYELTKLSFTMGAAKDSDEWSDYVWYINLLGENDVDETFFIEDICQAALKVANSETYYGDSNGGTTIQLPFGFVQWHQSQMQFHHSYEKVCHLIEIL
ncbi:MAG: hypothetical protein K6F86_06950 [Lachnospiraceae bacterium]|nr:hypothetical protein [Lachnospiraceae bacterium]